VGRTSENDKLIRKAAKLAFGKANDPVKLVFMTPEQQEMIDRLDLSLLSEVRRGANGVIEIKLVNRLEALELLAGLMGAGEGAEGKESDIFRALDEAAARLGERRGENR